MTVNVVSTLAVNNSNHNNESITHQMDFMEAAQRYTSYQIAMYINKFYFPILVPIGLVGNTLSFLVMIKPSNRRLSTCVYMAAISVNDNLMMCMAFHDWLVSVPKTHPWHLWECKMSAYLTMFCLQNSTYQVLTMTIDKYIVIKWPHKASVLSTPRRAKMVALGICTYSLVYNIKHLITFTTFNGECMAYNREGLVNAIFSWMGFIFTGVIPISLLAYMNSVILRTVRKSGNIFTNGGDSLEFSKVRKKTMKSAENQLTIMLLLVTMLFLVLLIPTYIRYLYLTFVDSSTPRGYANIVLFSQVTYKLYTTSNGINFFLYCISGKRFRNDIKELVSCGKSAEGINVRQTQTNATGLSSVNSKEEITREKKSQIL